MKKMQLPSIFNNVIGPIMRGPSSSHTAASVRIGLLGKNLLGDTPRRAVFTFDPDGSLATTYRGQGSAMGLAAGLLGMKISDPGLIEAEEICEKKGMELLFRIEPIGSSHPNTYDVHLTGYDGEQLSFTALSTGGGLISLTELNGRAVADDQPYIAPLMPIKISGNSLPRFVDLNTLHDCLSKSNPKKLSEMALEYETALGDTDEEGIRCLTAQHLKVMLESVKTGRAGTSYDDRILPRQSHLIDREGKSSSLIPADLINRVISNVTAVMETKSSMGVIAAAPTAGSCGTLAGTLSAVSEVLHLAGEDLENAVLAAGLVGVFISQQGGFAAEAGGCQYECGAASGMTAAALVDLMGGRAEVSLAASSMALQNTMGLICDPVADRVEVPCLGKNIMAALNAVASANMALAGYAQVIPLVQVIAAMREVGDGMDSKYCCTCKGGLSITPTARVIQRGLMPKAAE